MEMEQFLVGSPRETKPVLLELARRQAAARPASALLRQWAADDSVGPSALDLRAAVTLDAMALDAAAEFEALLLSPVAPLGCCSVVAPTSQDRTLTTTRGTEVVSDPTNVLALECARRMRLGHAGPHRLITIHQVLRMQPIARAPGRTRHFRLLGAAIAGRATPNEGFEVAAYAEIAGVYDRLLSRFSAATGIDSSSREAVLQVSTTGATLAQRVAEAIEDQLAHFTVRYEELAGPYYDGLRVEIRAGLAGAEPSEVGDIGRVGWLGALTSNRANRLVIGGFGLQLLGLAAQAPFGSASHGVLCARFPD